MSLCGTDDDKQLKIELLSQWKLEAEFRNLGNAWKKPFIFAGGLPLGWATPQHLYGSYLWEAFHKKMSQSYELDTNPPSCTPSLLRRKLLVDFLVQYISDSCCMYAMRQHCIGWKTDGNRHHRRMLAWWMCVYIVCINHIMSITTWLQM